MECSCPYVKSSVQKYLGHDLLSLFNVNYICDCSGNWVAQCLWQMSCVACSIIVHFTKILLLLKLCLYVIKTVHSRKWVLKICYFVKIALFWSSSMHWCHFLFGLPRYAEGKIASQLALDESTIRSQAPSAARPIAGYNIRRLSAKCKPGV